MNYKKSVKNWYKNAEAVMLNINGETFFAITLEPTPATEIAANVNIKHAYTLAYTENQSWGKAHQNYVIPIEDNAHYFGLVRDLISKMESHFNEMRLAFNEAIYLKQIQDKKLYELATLPKADFNRLSQIVKDCDTRLVDRFENESDDPCNGERCDENECDDCGCCNDCCE